MVYLKLKPMREKIFFLKIWFPKFKESNVLTFLLEHSNCNLQFENSKWNFIQNR